VVDPNEPPMPPMISPMQALHMGEALARGDVNRERIGVTLFRDVVSEKGYAAAPAGVLERVKDAVEGVLPGHHDGAGNGHTQQNDPGENV
jgi:hypothetical protein